MLVSGRYLGLTNTQNPGISTGIGTEKSSQCIPATCCRDLQSKGDDAWGSFLWSRRSKRAVLSQRHCSKLPCVSSPLGFAGMQRPLWQSGAALCRVAYTGSGDAALPHKCASLLWVWPEWISCSRVPWFRGPSPVLLNNIPTCRVCA